METTEPSGLLCQNVFDPLRLYVLIDGIFPISNGSIGFEYINREIGPVLNKTNIDILNGLAEEMKLELFAQFLSKNRWINERLFSKEISSMPPKRDEWTGDLKRYISITGSDIPEKK